MPRRFDNLPAPVQAVTLIVVAAALATGVFFFGVPGVFDSVWSLSAKKPFLEKQVETLKGENDKKEVFQQQRTEYLERIVQLEKQIRTLRRILPDEPATDQFRRRVYEAGRATGVRLRTLVAGPMVPHDFYMELPFTARVDGTYASLLIFFDRLAHEQRLVSATGLSLGPPEGGATERFRIRPDVLLGATCVVSTYFLRPAVAPALSHARK